MMSFSFKCLVGDILGLQRIASANGDFLGQSVALNLK